MHFSHAIHTPQSFLNPLHAIVAGHSINPDVVRFQCAGSSYIFAFVHNYLVLFYPRTKVAASKWPNPAHCTP